MSLKDFAGALPEFAKDIRLNVGSLLNEQHLSDQQKFGLLLTCAHGTGYKPLVEATEAEVAEKLTPEAANAARAAAAVMAMNNVYYRFVHLAGNPEYGNMPAKLRMNVIGAYKGDAKNDFELVSLAVSAVNGCGMCIDSHDKVLRDGGISVQAIQSAVRIASVIHGVAVVLEQADAAG